MRKAFVVAALLAGCCPAMADEGECLGWDNLSGTPALAIGSVAAARAHFVKNASDDPACPAEGAACQRKGFVVKGDELILSARQDGFVCASYVSAKGLETAGWLAQADVSETPPGPAAKLDDWLGTWGGNVEQSIAIKRGKAAGTLAINGDATFGASDPARVKRGAVNIGSIEATIAPKGARLGFGVGDGATVAWEDAPEFACRVRMLRLGAFLIVEDNRQCGGNNVSFTGDYRRK